MTARNGSAEWHGRVESGSGAITVGNGVFKGAHVDWREACRLVHDAYRAWASAA
jgi:hypothetical protein